MLKLDRYLKFHKHYNFVFIFNCDFVKLTITLNKIKYILVLSFICMLFY